jgi:DNA topoisomerase I
MSVVGKKADSRYTLVICEKPDAARRVSDALSQGSSKMMVVDGTTAFSFARRGEEFVVCSAQGHVFGVSDPLDERVVYPVFDVEWYSSDLVDERSVGAGRRVSAIRKLAAGASKFVNACDFDVEGETIGFNLLRYACGGKEGVAFRAKFSTLTEEDLGKAFDGLKPQDGSGLARAGRARHVIDFIWGINLSRALSQSALRSGHRYRTVSVGRVQGPTLGFLVLKEREIRGHVPLPYWRISGILEKDGRRITVGYSKERVGTKSLAEKIRGECTGKEAVATSVRRNSIRVDPPPPFNVGDLQREAYRVFRFAPSRTLQIAERLYLSALVSYPRTGSQRLPPSIGYREIVRGLGRIPQYSGSADATLNSVLDPVQGSKTDPAHPAIHPTGDVPRRRLDASEASIFDLVVRRFLAAFGPPARRELFEVSFAVTGHEFGLAGGRTLSPGWMKHYGKYAWHKDVEFPEISQGDRYVVVDVTAEAKFEPKPARYNQSSLLEKMEKEEIGTKATRADIIATLVGRGYVSGEALEVSDLGFSVFDAMAKYAPSIMSTELTRGVESKLEAIEEGEGEAALLRAMVRSIAEQLANLGANEEAIGMNIDSALTRGAAKLLELGDCPVCKRGRLRVVRSKTTKKRFVGCSNYVTGCRASAPLPQKGTIKTTTKGCASCGWPIVYVTGGNRPWRLCVNPGCPEKKR